MIPRALPVQERDAGDRVDGNRIEGDRGGGDRGGGDPYAHARGADRQRARGHTSGHARGRLRRWLLTSTWLLLLTAGAVLLYGSLRIPEYIVPSPPTIGRGLVEHRELLARHLVPTLIEAVAGFVIGNGLACLVAAVAVHSASASRIILPVSLVLRSVPILALTPVLTLWLGLFLAPKIAIVVLLTFFPTLIVTMRGLASADPLVLDVLQTINASRMQVFLKVRVPTSLPYVFAGLKIAAPSAVSGALVAEWLGSNQGIGHLMATAAFEFRIGLLWAAIVVASALGVVAYGAVVLVQHWLVPWSAGDVG